MLTLKVKYSPYISFEVFVPHAGKILTKLYSPNYTKFDFFDKNIVSFFNPLLIKQFLKIFCFHHHQLNDANDEFSITN